MFGSAKNTLLPVLPLRDIVVFPGMIVPLFVGRDKSIAALEEVQQDNNSRILLVTQKDANQDAPGAGDLYQVGVQASILQMLRLPDGTVKVLVEGKERTTVRECHDNGAYLEASVTVLDDAVQQSEELEAMARSVVASFEEYIKLNKKIPSEIIENIKEMEDVVRICDVIASHLSLRIAEKQELLEIDSVFTRLERIFGFMEREVGVLTTEKKIRSRVRGQMEKTQREYFLNEQMKAIQKELGDQDAKDDLEEIAQKIQDVKLSKEAKEKATSELKKLRHMSPMSAEASVVRNYLDWLLGIPWNKKSRLSKKIDKAEVVLDDGHYGLEKVKERIIEHLAVQQRKNTLTGQILCFVGPPGVGKTSLAKSIAEATGRKFVRLALGGVRDESEIRGHRRTYIGALPGKIVQSMKKSGTTNPLFLLDEIDKMGQDFRGDPASALLEVLDPEQNKSFGDHYLEVEYDLSDVMFITTANTMNMPGPLRDRMEIIRLSGYTEDEKVEIAKRHLLPKQIEKHALKKGEFSITDAAIRYLIAHYTRESGVRNLERELAKLCRKAVTQIVKNETESVAITEKNVKDFSGVLRFEHNVKDKDDHIGVTTGLAYTEVGGDLLPIEAVLIPGGKGRITLTGKLGDVMQESAQAAWSYIRSRSHDFGIKSEEFWKQDMHIHVPEGATPKDGPSAGIAISTSIVSALTGVPVRRHVAMTGEISLRGMVMPIGGLKEKLLAAQRGGIKTVLIPEKNVKDLEEIPETIKDALEIIPVTKLDEVLKHALTGKLKPISWEESQASLASLSPTEAGGEARPH